MPIRPEMAARYPMDWKRRSWFVRAYRAKWACEWCGAKQHEPHPITGSRVVLTVAHVWDHRPEAASLLNLAALCQLKADFTLLPDGQPNWRCVKEHDLIKAIAAALRAERERNARIAEVYENCMEEGLPEKERMARLYQQTTARFIAAAIRAGGKL